MKEKKNIDRLFQEKFKNFEVQPPKDAWKNISAKLPNSKEPKKILPLWIKLSGTAVILMLGLFFIKDSFFDDKIIVTNQEEKHLQDPSKKTLDNSKEIEAPEKEKEAVTISSQKQDVINNNKTNTTDYDVYVEANSNSYQKNNSVTHPNNTLKKQDPKKETGIKTQPVQVVINTDADGENIKKPSDINSSVVTSKEKHFEKSDKTIESNIARTIVNNNSDKDLFSNKRDLFDNDIKISNDNDSINAIANGQTNELQKLLEEMNADKQEESKETPLQNRWRVTPNIAPVTMYSLTEGSSVSNSFIDNSKENQTTLSYGLAFSYAFNKKLNIRTGINKVSLGYNTNNVEIYATTDIRDMLANAVNINFNETSGNIVVKPESNFTGQSGFGPSTGKINQQIGFIEVPVELSYKLLESRFGIEIIGGMSTLFLNENEISVISNGMSTALGEANNLNDVHFSTNLGVGFKYEIFKSFEASLEPMFKYQMGTFNKNDGNFKPYILGLYTGLSFKF